MPRRLRPYEHLYKRLVWSAAYRKLPVSLTYEEFISFTSVTECHYCYGAIVWSLYKRTKTTTSAYNLDRLDATKGYSLDNVAVCCRRCNLSRKLYTPEEWLVMSRAFYVYHHGWE